MDEKDSTPTSTGDVSSSSVSSVVNRTKEQALVRKIDLHLMPVLTIMCMVTFLDRVNISSALTLGLPEQLGLTGQQPNVALLVFFIPYILFEIPSNIMVKKLKPSVWMAGCITLFGVITICQGFVRNYAGLVAARFSLGVAEAGALPGALYVLSFWYRREEAQRRFTLFWSALMVAWAFGGLIATGLAKLDGTGGLISWRRIFIVEGIFTVLVGFAGFFFLADFPVRASWLTLEEKVMVSERTFDDVKESDTVTFRAVLNFFKEPYGLLGSAMYFSILFPIYCFSYFTPTIIQGMGYSAVQTQLHSVPPYAASLALCWVMAIISDRYKARAPFVLFGQGLLIIGVSILITTHGKEHFATQYAGMHLVLMGAFSAGAGILCWCLMNLHGHVEKAVGSGWMVAFGNSSGIVAAFAFLKADAPEYRMGYSLCLVVSVLGFLCTSVYSLLVIRDRRKAGDGSRPKPLL